MDDVFDDPDRAVQIEDFDPESLAGDDVLFDPDADYVDYPDEAETPSEVGDRWLGRP